MLKSVVKMTSRSVGQILAQSGRITEAELTEQHLDVIQMQDIGNEARVALIYASDDLQAGKKASPAITVMVGEWNKRCGQPR